MVHYFLPKAGRNRIKSISHNASENFWIALLKNLLLVAYVPCACHHRNVPWYTVFTVQQSPLQIIFKKTSNKNCLELNFLQKTQWVHMSISSSSGARGLERLPFFKYYNVLEWESRRGVLFQNAISPKIQNWENHKNVVNSVLL